jgi:nucleoside-diphosphate-sugar epimerase
VNNPRHVLVTGAAGNIGGEIVRYLRSEGVAVTALSNVAADGLEAERVVLGDAADAELVAGVLRDPAELPPLDGVVHMAALPHFDSGTPLEVYGTNVLTTFNVLVQAAEAGVERAVIASSVNASGLPFNTHDVRPPYYPIDVDVPADIADWYSLSKAADELTCRMVARRWGTTVVALRFPYTNDAERIDWYSGVVTDDPVRGVNDGWAFLHHRDAARAALLSLTVDLSGFHALHVVAPTTLVPYATADLLDRYAPDVPRRRELGEREPALDMTEARRLLGFEAEFALELELRPLPQELAAR